MQKKYLVHIPLEYWLSRMQTKVKFLYIMGEKNENRRFFVRIYQEGPFDQAPPILSIIGSI